MKELSEKLRVLSDKLIPENEEFWTGAIQPLLPKEPLSIEFLKEALAPLHALKKAIALEFLARLGRHEVAAMAKELLKDGGIDATARLELAVALVHCGDPRGFRTIDEMFNDSVRHPEDKKRSVPIDWILQDTLRERLGTPEALELRLRLVAAYNSSRSKTN